MRPLSQEPPLYPDPLPAGDALGDERVVQRAQQASGLAIPFPPDGARLRHDVMLFCHGGYRAQHRDTPSCSLLARYETRPPRLPFTTLAVR